MSKNEHIILSEQNTYQGDDVGDVMATLQENNVELVGLPENYMGTPKYLGIDSNLCAGYFVGATWLIPGNLSAVVRPKVQNIDIAEMLILALSASTEEEAEYFSKCYSINFEESAIETEESQTLLSPLLIIHFITLLEHLVKHGLRKDYVTVTENLTGKLKGHLICNMQLRQNIIPKREYRNVCRYQIYTSDIPINRLLKRALVFADKMLLVYMRKHKSFNFLQAKVNKLLTVFEGVSDQISISQARSMAANKLYRHYDEAVKVAKEILRRFDYSLSNVSTTCHSTPPFWIDMSRLFEMYVLSMLRKSYGSDIMFQVKGHSQVADYISVKENCVIDAKYKEWYVGEGISGELIKDIREISGNARDKKITSLLSEPGCEPECVIVYPNANGIKSFQTSLVEEAHHNPISQFRKFYKIPISLPILGI